MGRGAFRFGHWWVWPQTNSIGDEDRRQHLEPRLMQVLCALCDHAGEVLSADELLRLCWGTTVYGDGPVHKAMAQLRKALGDRPGEASYIQTIRKRGYRAVAPVVPVEGRPLGHRQGKWSGGSPFRGMEPFDPRHTDVFFGRNKAESALLACLRAQVAQGAGMALLLGPSGSGKTSLVQAGLMPALQRGPLEGLLVSCTATVDLAMMDADDPWGLLAQALMDCQIDGRPLVMADQKEVLSGRLAHSSDLAASQIRWELDARSGAQKARPVLGLFVDQFERLLASPAQSEAFAATLHTLAASGRVLVVVACRNDFYPLLVRVPTFMALKSKGGHFDLPAAGEAEIAQMIRLPAHIAGLTFGVDPVTRMRLDDALCSEATASPDALPLLQYALHLLYEARTPLDELDFEAYRRIGGIEGAISYRAEALLDTLEPQQQACLPKVLALLVAMSEEGDMLCSRRVPWSALQTEVEIALVRALVDARLLVSTLVADDPGFGVAHEALLRRWPRATAWIDQHRALLRTRTRLVALAARWQREGRTPDLLLPHGRQLDEARQVLETKSIPLSDVERDLVHASEVRATRARRLRHALFGGVLVLSAVSAVLGLIAVHANGLAQTRRAQAEDLMGYMLGDFADNLRPLGRLDLLEGISEKAFGYLSVDDQRNAAGARQRAQALQVIAEVRIARGESAGAATALDTAHALLLRHLAASPNDVEGLKLLGANAFWRGKIRLDRDDWKRAQLDFMDYLKTSQHWRRLRPNDDDAKVEESYAFNSLGSLWMRHGRIEPAAHAFARSVALKRMVLERRPGDTALRAELADSLTWAATAQQKNGQLQIALASNRSAVDMIQRLLRDPTDAVWQQRLAYALMHSAQLRLAVGDQRDAVAELQQAHQTLQDIVAMQPDNLTWQRDLLYATLQLELARPRASAVESASALAAILESLESLTGRDPENAQWLRLQATVMMHLAVSESRQGGKVRASEKMERALVLLQRAHHANPESVSTREALVDAWLAAARLSSRPQDAAVRCRRAIALLRPYVNDTRDYSMLLAWMHAQTCLGHSAAADRASRALDAIGYRGDRRGHWNRSTLQ